jgi:antitoxin component YwqK of YwqJK toxin-antitoxin module
VNLKVAFLLIIISFSFSGLLFSQNEIEIRPRYAPASDKHRNVYDEMGLKQGLWKYYTRDGILYYEITFQNDIKHGPCIRHHTANGVVVEESNYFNGKRDGEYRRFSFTGSLITEGSYSNNRKTDKWTSYYAVNGEKKNEGYYISGKRSGPWVYFTSKGKLKLQGDYKEGLKEGVWITYNTDGSVLEQKKFVKGVAIEDAKTTTPGTNSNKGGQKNIKKPTGNIKKTTQQPPSNTNQGSGTNNSKPTN